MPLVLDISRERKYVDGGLEKVHAKVKSHLSANETEESAFDPGSDGGRGPVPKRGRKRTHNQAIG